MRLLHLQQAPRLRTWWETCSEDSTFRERQRAARGRDPHSTPAKAGCCCWLLSTAWHSSLLPLFLLPPHFYWSSKMSSTIFPSPPPPPPQTTTSRLIYPKFHILCCFKQDQMLPETASRTRGTGLNLFWEGKPYRIVCFHSAVRHSS